MCAIFGARKYVDFMRLYQQNRERGDFAFGAVFIGTAPQIIKTPGTYSGKLRGDFGYFIGHTQAPTSAVQTYNPQTSHPFVCGDWVVAHNGVLTNYTELAAEIENKSTYNEVDSSLIPALLTQRTSNNLDEPTLIASVMASLRGTYTCWLFNQKTKNLYIARCGSTLWVSEDQVSSTEIPEGESFPEGGIACITEGKLQQVNTFTPASPFFIL